MGVLLANIKFAVIAQMCLVQSLLVEVRQPDKLLGILVADLNFWLLLTIFYDRI
jgi:hypothetical protein